MPSGTNGSWKRALVAAYTRSQCRSMVLPIPTAGPPTAATIGFARLGSTLNSSTTGGSAPAGRLRKSPTSLPAVKHSCEPWSRIARTCGSASAAASARSEEHTSELQSRLHLVCRLLLEKKKKERKHQLHIHS